MTRLLLIFVAVFALVALVACSPPAPWRRASGIVWATEYNITYQASQSLDDSIIAVARQIERSLSMFDRESTVGRINQRLTDSVDRHFVNVYNIARQVNRASGGLFDPTVAPLVDLWGFGRNGSDTPIPDSAQIARTLRRVGIYRTDIRDGRLDNPDSVEFDFSAIAKGYGVDQVAQMLRRNGVQNYLVEIGGEISLAGHSPSGGLWRIQIDAPVPDLSPGAEALTMLELSDCAIATSGNYRNYREEGGRKLGHTIDPLSGLPSQSEILSATVIAPECALADALATALMASPLDSAASVLGRFGAGAILATPDTLLRLP